MEETRQAVEAAEETKMFLDQAVQEALSKHKKIMNLRYLTTERDLQNSFGRDLFANKASFSAKFQNASQPAVLPWYQAVNERVIAERDKRMVLCQKLYRNCLAVESLQWKARLQAQQLFSFKSSKNYSSYASSADEQHQAASCLLPPGEFENDDLESFNAIIDYSDDDFVRVIQPLEQAYCNYSQYDEVLSTKRDLCKNRLWNTCRLPMDSIKCSLKKSFQKNNESEHLQTFTNSVKDSKMGDRGLVGLRVHPSVWKRHLDLYQGNVTLSFLLQYFRQPGNAPDVVNRLYKCTRGSLGRGQVKGVTTELLVHVDEPSAVRMWNKLWKTTKVGRFLVPVFSHNLGEVRGYNRLAQIARGRIIMLLQDDELPPESCATWLPRVLQMFDTWPRIGVIGMRNSNLAAKEDLPPLVRDYRFADTLEHMTLYDGLTQIRMLFATMVDSSPMLYRRRLYLDLGGQDEGAMGGKAESGICTDWDMALRTWFSGFFVAHPALNVIDMFLNPDGVEANTRSGGVGEAIRRLNSHLNKWSKEEDIVFEEVKRVNHFLRNVDPWK